MARFRPLNTIELELQELNPQKQADIIGFSEDLQTVKVHDEFHTHNSSSNVFTFDHIFKPQTSQEEVFEFVGKQMIEDIMCGYNGTIFAYGQTGSGKTFTMYGEDLFDESLMGLVPRAARQIFDHIRDQDLEVEYSIRVQMVEIYKETLRDLLHNSNERAPELKIKEDPKRGTYVEGL
jgi:kinesin family member 5